MMRTINKRVITPIALMSLLFFQSSCVASSSKMTKNSEKIASLSYKSDVNGGGMMPLSLKNVKAYYTISNNKFYATMQYLNKTGKPGQHAMAFDLFFVGSVSNDKSEEASIKSAYMIHALHRTTHSAMLIDNVRLNGGLSDKIELSLSLMSKRVYPEYASFNKYSVDMINIPVVKVNSLRDLKEFNLEPTSYADILRRNFKVY